MFFHVNTVSTPDAIANIVYCLLRNVTKVKKSCFMLTVNVLYL